MKVKEIMSPNAVCIRASASLAEAGALMRQLNVRVIPVCENSRFIGVICERDVASGSLAELTEPTLRPVRDAITRGPIFVFDDEPVSLAAGKMEESELDRLPVLDRTHRLVGVLALSDFVPHGDADLEISAPTRGEPSPPPPTRRAEP